MMSVIYEHAACLTKKCGDGINNMYTYTNLDSISAEMDIISNWILFEYDDLKRVMVDLLVLRRRRLNDETRNFKITKIYYVYSFCKLVHIFYCILQFI